MPKNCSLLFVFMVVLVCTGSYAKRYHSNYCGGVKKCSSNIVSMSVAEAQKRGLTACGICYK